MNTERSDRPHQPATGRRGLARRFVGILASVLLSGALMAGVGFIWFAEKVASYQMPEDARAEGIVVLTGGPDRLRAAYDLLARGRAHRMLISGVGPTTQPAEVALDLGVGLSLFDCCIDLDREAINTAGNAFQAARWAEDNRYTSLIVVTSAYHMPRSLSEFRRQLPGVTLIAYPVFHRAASIEKWFEDPEVLKLLLQEFPKYMAAELKRIGG